MAVDIDFPTYATQSVFSAPRDARKLQYDFAPEHQYFYYYPTDFDLRELLDVRTRHPGTNMIDGAKSRAGGFTYTEYTILWTYREYFILEMMYFYGYYPEICTPMDIKTQMLSHLSRATFPKFLYRWMMSLVIDMYIDGPGPWADESKTERIREQLC